MQTFSEYITDYFSSLYFPKETDIDKKIDVIMRSAKEPYIQLIKYRNLENYYSCFYKDQLSAEVKDIVKNVWFMKREIFKNIDSTTIINSLNEHKSQYNKILFQLYKNKYRIYKQLSTNDIQKQAYKQLFHISMQIIYYSQLKDCIDQLFHKFVAILYI